MSAVNSVAAGVLVALVLTAGPARAAQRVFLGGFGADEPASALRTAVKGILEKQGYDILEDEKLQASPASPTNELADLGKKFAAEGVVAGALEQNQRKHWVLTLVLVSSRGKAGTIRLDLGRGPKLSKATKAKLQRQLVAKLKLFAAGPEAEAEEAPAAAAHVAPTETPPPTPPASPPTAAAPVSEPEKPPPAEERSEAEKPPEEPAEAEAPPAPAAAPAPMIIVDERPPRPFKTFALFRSALPEDLATVRGFWDSRKTSGFELSGALRLPLDFTFLHRLTLHSSAVEEDLLDLETFDVSAFLLSPMVYSLGVVAEYGGATGPDNDVLRLGVAQTFLLQLGPVRVHSLLAVLPYDSAVSGGRVFHRLEARVGPLRSEVTTVYAWSDPSFFAIRPDLRLRIWKAFGLYAQLDRDGSLPMKKTGYRLGVELQATF